MSRDVPSNPTPKDFTQTEEAQEYLVKLQTGKAPLTGEANTLEQKAYESLRGLNGKIRQLSTEQGDLDKQIAALQGQRATIGRDIDVSTGQATAYASLLVSAEGGRREDKATELAAERAEAGADDKAISEVVEQEAIAEVKAELAAGRTEAGDDASLVSNDPIENVELGSSEQQPQPLV